MPPPRSRERRRQRRRGPPRHRARHHHDRPGPRPPRTPAPTSPGTGDELATARALSDLAHQLLDAAPADVEDVTRRPAHPPR
ncbi:dsRBD fold-containing protein [Actinosynnema sp. NPDC059797]